jgi:SAM-dependent methyltransferase
LTWPSIWPAASPIKIIRAAWTRSSISPGRWGPLRAPGSSTWAAARYLDAVALTELVGLNERVRFVHGDFLRVEFPPGHFDGVVLLDSFGHFPDKPALLKRCLDVCRPGGRVAIQEVTLLRPPRPAELDLLAELAGHWNVYFVSRDGWLPPLTSLAQVEDEIGLHLEWRCHNERLLTLAGKPGAGPVASREKRAWELSLRMSDAGLLGYTRTVLSRL